MLMMLCLLQVIAPAALFLAAKVEEQPRKLEHVIKVAHACLNPQEPSPDVRSDVSVQLCVLLVLLSTKHQCKVVFTPNLALSLKRSVSH